MPNDDKKEDRSDKDESITIRALAWLLKQKPETVLTFAVLGFMGYWLIYEHPETIARSREWHKAENIRTTDAIDAITKTNADAIKEATEIQAKAVKEAAEIQARAVVESAKEHSEEVKDTTASYEKTLNRISDIYDRNHLREKKE
jgi:hypothetical protein